MAAMVLGRACRGHAGQELLESFSACQCGIILVLAGAPPMHGDKW